MLHRVNIVVYTFYNIKYVFLVPSMYLYRLYIYVYNIVKAECVEPAAAFYLRLMRAIMNNLMLIRVIKYITECICRGRIIAFLTILL